METISIDYVLFIFIFKRILFFQEVKNIPIVFILAPSAARGAARRLSSLEVTTSELHIYIWSENSSLKTEGKTVGN